MAPSTRQEELLDQLENIVLLIAFECLSERLLNIDFRIFISMYFIKGSRHHSGRNKGRSMKRCPDRCFNHRCEDAVASQVALPPMPNSWRSWPTSSWKGRADLGKYHSARKFLPFYALCPTLLWTGSQRCGERNSWIWWMRGLLRLRRRICVPYNDPSSWLQARADFHRPLILLRDRHDCFHALCSFQVWQSRQDTCELVWQSWTWSRIASYQSLSCWWIHFSSFFGKLS